MIPSISYSDLYNFHQLIANAHVDIRSFYRIDFAELQGALRHQVEQSPVLFMEAPSIMLSSENKGVSTFGNRANSLLILETVREIDNTQEVEDALTKTERIALDICSYLDHKSKDSSHFLFGRFDINNVAIEKVGPLIDNYYGWNILYQIKTFESMKYNPEKWQF